MGKDNALGYDPLGWMKVTSENKKTPSTEGVNEKDQNIEKPKENTDSRINVKQQTPISAVNNENPDISKVSPPQDKVPRVLENDTAAAKPRVVIGRLYEKPSPEKIKPVQPNDNISQEARRYTEFSFPGPKSIQPVKKRDTEVNRLHPSANGGFSTYIIIAYTALLLILGYFVYNDLSKRINRIDARIIAIEKALHTEEE